MSMNFKIEFRGIFAFFEKDHSAALGI